MHRFRLQSACFVLMLAIPFAGFAQQTPPAAPRLSEKIEVRVVSVDVTVTDKAGKPITGLTKDDFEIIEDKVSQPIVNFYEAKPEAYAALEAPAAASDAQPAVTQPLPPPPPRRVVFYIDNLTLTGAQRNRLITEMKSFVGETMRPHDEVMIATFNHLLKIPLPFTDDRARIDSTLDNLMREPAFGETRFHEASQVQQDIHASGNSNQRVWLAKAYAQTVLNDVQQSAKAVKTLMTNLAGLEGKKVLVLASEGFPTQPGVEMFEYIDNLGGSDVSTRDEVRRRVPEAPQPRGGTNNQTPPPPENNPPPMIKMRATTVANAREFNAEKIIQSVASNANANGIVLYTIHAGALDGGSGAGADRSRAISNSVVMQSRANSEMGLKSLADLTGGIASVASKHGRIFDDIRRDLDSFYSLGYRPTGGEGERNLRVKLKKGRYIVRARRSNVQKSLEQEMTDRVLANLLSKPRSNDLNVSVTASAVEDKGKTRVPVKIHVPMESLTLLEQSSGGLEGGFDVFVVVADAGGALSPVVHRTQKVGVAASQLENYKGTNYTFALDFLMNREAARVSVAIVDSVSNATSFARYDR